MQVALQLQDAALPAVSTHMKCACRAVLCGCHVSCFSPNTQGSVLYTLHCQVYFISAGCVTLFCWLGLALTSSLTLKQTGAHLNPSGSYFALQAGSTSRFTRDSHTCTTAHKKGVSGFVSTLCVCCLPLQRPIIINTCQDYQYLSRYSRHLPTAGLQGEVEVIHSTCGRGQRQSLTNNPVAQAQCSRTTYCLYIMPNTAADTAHRQLKPEPSEAQINVHVLVRSSVTRHTSHVTSRHVRHVTLCQTRHVPSRQTRHTQ